MASQQDNVHDHDHLTTLYPDEEEEEDDDDTEDDDPNHPLNDVDDDDSISSGAGEVTIAVAGLSSTSTVTATPPATITTGTITLSPLPGSGNNIIIPDQKKLVPLDDSRRLFQRLWTDEDEIELLQGFLDYNNQRLANNPFHHHHHHDTTVFYDQIKDKLQLEFNKNQLVEKLRRLKKKYRNVLSKISSGKEYVFKTAHDQLTFDLSCKIWGNEAAAVSTPAAADRFDDDDVNKLNPNLNVGFNLNDQNGHGHGVGVGVGVGYVNSLEKKVPRSRKRSRVKIEEKVNPQQPDPPAISNSVPVPVPNLVEETVKSCLLPLFKELVEGSARGFRGFGLGGMGLDPFSLSFGGLMSMPFGDVTDDKWRKQQILELEVCSKRLELVQEHIKSQLEELKSTRR